MADRKQANIDAWGEGKRRLELAIQDGKDYAFETILGVSTMAR